MMRGRVLAVPMDKGNLAALMQRLQFGLHRRLPAFWQSESAECGLVCLTMIAHYYGDNVEPHAMRARFNVSAHGATLAQLMAFASDLQLQSRAVSLDLHELGALRVPCILHWDMNHFVVLARVTSTHVVIHDPALGRRKYRISHISPHFTGVALELWPQSQFKKTSQRPALTLRHLLQHIRGLRQALINIFCLSLLIEVINLMMPIGMQLVMDHVIIAEDHHLLILICLGLFFFVVFSSGMAAIRAWAGIVLGVSIDVQWKSGVMAHLLRLPLAYFEKRKLGDIQARFQSADMVRSTLTTGGVSGMIDVLMTVGLFVMLWLYGGWLVWVVCGFTLIYLILRVATFSYYRTASEEKMVKEAKAHSHFMESLYGVATLKALGLGEMRQQQWLNLSVDCMNAGIRLTRFDLLFSGATTCIAALDQVLILWLGAHAVMASNLSLGMFVAFNAYRGLFSERASALIHVFLQMRMLALHAERLADIVLSTAEPQQPVRPFTAVGQAADFELRAIRFQFDGVSPPLLCGVDLQVAAGESMAITGVSGSGKSTLLKIMTGLIVPTSGQIMCNGVDIHALGLNNYRQLMACVLQDDKLFAGSIADNICSFAAEKERAFMITCAQQCHIHDEIMCMPMGYETILTELGGGLSGGQKQRLLIARALYRRPSILFLDEATSHLDVDNETAVNAAIAQLPITRIFIAHRPSTIASADRVIVL
jgi:ATP-binding cassette subfamily B protein RaxB